MTVTPGSPPPAPPPHPAPAHRRAHPDDRGPDVRFPPPLLFVAMFVVGVVLQWLIPLPASFRTTTWAAIVGAAMVIGGFALVFTGIRTFRRSRTPVYPNRPARRIVTHGVYRFTRNPMYVGMITLYLGGVVATALLWPLLLLPVVVAVLTATVIRKEERHLHAAFPEEYGAYARRVRRWV